MTHVTGTRRVRMVGAEHWTDSPERDLVTYAVGADTYAVHERFCIDTPRLRLVLGDGEDVAAAVRLQPGEVVRDVRVFRLADTAHDVADGLPEWRLTLPFADEHDALPGMLERLAGPAAFPAAPEAEPVAPVLALVDDVPALEPLPVDVPVAVVADPVDDPYAVPAEAALPQEAPEDTVVLAPVVVTTEDATDEVVEGPVADEPVAVDDVAVVDVAEPVAVEPEPEPEPDPRDLLFAPVATVIAAGVPTCAGIDRDGGCSASAEVVWQTPAGPAWACAWHWPSTMAGHHGAEIGAVRQDGAWITYRDADSVDLARAAADLFAENARGHEKPVARPLVALDTFDDMHRRLPDDLRGAVVLWAVSVTNPEWPVETVAEHGRAALGQAALEGRAVAFPDELYFQDHAATPSISAVVTEDGEEVVEAPSVDGDALFAKGTAAAAEGDVRGATGFWTQAAEVAQHVGSMRALGDLALERDDSKSAEEWYGQAAMAGDAGSMTRIGEIYIRKGQPERATEWLRRAARFGDEDAARQLQGLMAATA